MSMSGSESRYPPPMSLPYETNAPAHPSSTVPSRLPQGRRASQPSERRVSNHISSSRGPGALKQSLDPSATYYSANNYDYEEPANPTAGSFAQRAAVLTGRSLPPDPNSSNRRSENPNLAKKERRTSLNRPIGGLYSEIQQHRRDSWPAGKSPTSPKSASFPHRPAESATRAASLSVQPTESNTPPVAAISAPEAQSSRPHRAATMSSSKAADKWASDRSPLQKLEVKLSDISKEEKRARVEQAEQKSREAKRQRMQRSQAVPDALAADNSPNPSHRGAARRPAGPRDLPKTDRQVSQREVSNGFSRKQRAPDSSELDEPVRDSSRERHSRQQHTGRSPGSTASSEPSEQDTGIRSTAMRHEPRQQASGARRASAGPGDTSRKVPRAQLDLYESRIERSNDDALATGEGAEEDAVPAAAATGAHKGLKYGLPPQTAAGIQARQRVGFDDTEFEPSQVPQQRKHRIPFSSHHKSQQAQTAHQEPRVGAKPLHEWKTAEVARLRHTDFADEATDESPWWEKQGSKRRRSSQRHSMEDPYPDGNGEYHMVPFSAPEVSPASSQDAIVRPYKTKSTERSHRRQILSTLKGDSSLRSRHALKTHVGLVSEYSYSCPALAVHDPSHPQHICEPYANKELTMSMRSIRVRTVPASTTFNPPLYLKCGPLLRYTGIKRQPLNTNVARDAQGTDQEFWRGSVMIVTTDADSNYDTVPTLRLFPEPMEKIPPPQQQRASEKDEDELPHHYLDPIAGMPKLSRTGKTVYVKPVDDLEHQKDLSKFENNDDGLYEDFRSAAVPTAYGTPEYRHGLNGSAPRQNRPKSKLRQGHKIKGVRLHAERGVTFWRFNLEVQLQEKETRVAYSINNGPALGFWVPGVGQTMNIMFHSCNGFSLGINPDDFCGPDPLWRDVLNCHQTQPFHVMIGGGDQIYNDSVMEQCPLFRDWLDIKNPHHKHEAEFTAELQSQLETFYLERYSMWFSQGLFGMANAQIPMVNIWDDHDIIDGFGSYPHHFMSTPVFCGLGAVAFKYYMLFQHQSVPAETTADEPSWLLGAAPGPYINEISRSIFLSLGKNVAFLGLDCRTERMREEILSEASYDLIFDRCRQEIVKGETKHLIVLLGVPIAYPRLVWLENVLTSRALDPIKAMGRIGMLGNLMNKFDGGVEILDDLDDHWTAKNHKQERNWFIQELQELAADLSVRVTILSGDVHLAAIGQFLSKPKMKIPKDQDHRYMPNIISSAIVNTPPPDMMSDVLNKRDKTHHLDQDTSENMIPVFSHDVDGRKRKNKRLFPRRNWLSICEYELGTTPPPSPSISEASTATPEDEGEHVHRTPLQRTLSMTRADIKPKRLLRRLSGRGPNSYLDEQGSLSPPRTQLNGTREHQRPSNIKSKPFASEGGDASVVGDTQPERPTFMRRPTDLGEKNNASHDENDTQHHINLEFGLDFCLHCEVNQQDPAGKTTPYRLLVPSLYYDGDRDENIAAFRRPKLLERLGSMKMPGLSGASKRHDDGEMWDDHSPPASDRSSEDTASKLPVKPRRRWSFGLDRRRRHRDETPSQDSLGAEPRRLGFFPQRPSGSGDSSGQHYGEPGAHQVDGSAEMDPPPAPSVPPMREANRFRSVDETDSEDGLSVDSIDYHANLSSGATRPEGEPAIRQRSKAEKMLGAVGIDRSFSVRAPARRVMSMPQRRYSEQQGYPDSNRQSGYDGIDAYSPDERRGWRKSLRLFT